MRRRLATGGSILLLLAVAAPANAQRVRGRLADAASARPVSGAAVTLLDLALSERAGAITDAEGGYVLRAPSPGTYRVRVRSPAHAEVLSGPLRLGAGAVVEWSVPLRPEVVQLDALVVTGSGSRCVRSPTDGEATERLWAQARKTLAPVALTEELRLGCFEVRDFRRALDGNGELRSDTSVTRSLSARSPYRSISVDSLMRRGFVFADGDSVTYLAPDAAVLLSDAFLEGHCYSVREDRARKPGQVGLAFEPIRRRRRAEEVRGVLWLDRAGRALRSLEYEYTRAPEPPRGQPRFGGTLEFDHVAGTWIVGRWVIRMPLLGRFDRVGQTVTAQVVGTQEVGGEVLRHPTAAPLANLAARASVAGCSADTVTVETRLLEMPEAPDGVWPGLVANRPFAPAGAAALRVGSTPYLAFGLPIRVSPERSPLVERRLTLVGEVQGIPVYAPERRADGAVREWVYLPFTSSCILQPYRVAGTDPAPGAGA